ncbi:RiPP maturation radical SAM C-methyltransferase, partial [Patescibacteria group bacterium]|nr:RiPP maturation radical SAM C-methyltransferase [Patescibacteria group bacterium]
NLLHEKKRALLISPPWADYQRPSLAIGCLSAFANQHGHPIETHHLHLEIASILGLELYNQIVFQDKYLGDAISGSLLFRDNIKFIKYVDRLLSPSVGRVVRGEFKTALWKYYCQLKKKKYSLIGITVDYQQLFTALVLSKWIKRDNRNTKVVLGGKCSSGNLGKSLLRHFDFVDWCIDGEGEQPYLKLLNISNDWNENSESQIPGLIYRRDGRIQVNKCTELRSMKQMGDPDYDSYFAFIENSPLLAGTEISPFIPVEMSRGCIHNCAFCSDRNYFKKYRVKPVKVVSQSIERVCRKYSTYRVFIVDRFVDFRYARKIFTLLSKHHLDYKLFCEIRAGIPKDTLSIMKKSGVDGVTIGIEALASSLLKKMNKGLRVIDNYQTMKHCEELGIRYDASNIILGYPLESRKDIERSINNIEYCLSYHPPSCTLFELQEQSLVHQQQRKYHIHSINEAGVLGNLVPSKYSNLSLWHKKFKGRNGVEKEHPLEKHIKRWSSVYEESLSEGMPLLFYLDHDKTIEINDFRSSYSCHRLDGWSRELYLFCDSIRSFKEMRERFRDIPEKELRRVLRQLFRLKVIYTEDDDWLALAIHASSQNRRFMPFL